jgi:hypothetical protein
MTVRRFAPRFLESFIFRASSDKNALLSALELLKRLNQEPRMALPEKPPLSFLPKSWQRLTVKDGGVDRRLYEIATLAILCRRLASGDIWIEGTRNYQQFDRYLLAKSEISEKAEALAVSSECDGYCRNAAKSSIGGCAVSPMPYAMIGSKASRFELGSSRIPDPGHRATGSRTSGQRP